MTKWVTVEAIGIENRMTGDDPGDDLEIYGHLGAWVIFINPAGHEQHRIQHLLMDRMNPSMRQSITEHATLHIGKTTPPMDVRPNEFLWIGGHLKEQDDTSANDSLGDNHLKFRYDILEGHVNEEKRVMFTESGQVVEAIFRIRFVPPPA
ncbi:hypothetical protein [Bradyrhizobium lablabi]|uniref:hypothetical protein n=1 Tax=Bradyrhizobium lablabi TaxID=722472 RepID=UPI001BA83158|nr:hypothetical protein [Bradyrhizobium lablabi]MBR0696003.1 hypothetical protein [Bradyrhizobium lablabi]